MQKISEVTDQDWECCNDYNRKITEEFLENSTQLSPKTIKSYRSNLRIWFNYVREHLDNKPQTEIKSREYLFYQNWLIRMDHSSSDITNKRAAVSSLNNYIVLFYSDVFPTFRNFIVRGMPKPEKSFVREKNPPTKEEIENMISKLEEMEAWQKIAWIRFSFDSASRRAESRQLLKNIVDYDPIVKSKTVTLEDGTVEVKTAIYYNTHKIRCKGRGVLGSQRKLRFGEETMRAFQKWMSIRGNDDCPYMFVTKRNGKVQQVSESTLNVWCSGLLSKILGKPFHPHSLRAARATSIVVEEGKSIEAAQSLLSHASSDTTKIYVIKDEDDDDILDLF